MLEIKKKEEIPINEFLKSLKRSSQIKRVLVKKKRFSQMVINTNKCVFEKKH